MANQRQPIGVTILAVLLLFVGIGSTMLGIGSVLLGFVVNALDAAAAARAIDSGNSEGPLLMLMGASAIAIGGVGLITSHGLINLKQYGWYLGVAWLISSLGLNLFILLRGWNILSVIIAMSISSLLLYDLFRPSVKRAFGKALVNPGKRQRVVSRK